MVPPGTIKPRLYGTELQSFMVRFRLGIFKKIQSQSIIEIIKPIWVPIPLLWRWAPSEKFLAPTGSKKFASGQAPHRIGIGSHMAPIAFITLWGLKCFGRNFFGTDWFQKKCLRSGTP